MGKYIPDVSGDADNLQGLVFFNFLYSVGVCIESCVSQTYPPVHNKGVRELPLIFGKKDMEDHLLSFFGIMIRKEDSYTEIVNNSRR